MTNNYPVFARKFLVVSGIFRKLDEKMAPLTTNNHLNLMAKKPFANSVILAETTSVMLLIYNTRKINLGNILTGVKTTV